MRVEETRETWMRRPTVWFDSTSSEDHWRSGEMSRMRAREASGRRAY